MFDLKSLVTLLLGPSWVSSLAGLVLALLAEGGIAAGKMQGYGWHLVALGFLALGRLMTDVFAKKGVKPDLSVVPQDPSQPPPAPPAQ